MKLQEDYESRMDDLSASKQEMRNSIIPNPFWIGKFFKHFVMVLGTIIIEQLPSLGLSEWLVGGAGEVDIKN